MHSERRLEFGQYAHIKELKLDTAHFVTNFIFLYIYIKLCISYYKIPFRRYRRI
jgi:hypothetical protein